MKKILSLVLVVAMLLSVVPMTWAAEQDLGTATEPKHFASLVLKDSIAINFKSTRAWLEAEGITKAEFTIGGDIVQTIEGIPAGDSELAVFSFTKLTPAQMAEKVTISYYAGETLVKSLTSSVLDYCTGACADANENPLLKTALVDMLSYGAAAMTYNKQAVDADLAAALTTYASYATTTEPTLSSKTALTGDEGDVKWLTAGLNLKDSVTLRFKFSTPEVDGLTLKLTSNGQTWEITNFYPVEGEAGNYYAYFNGLNPAQLRQLVYGEFYAEGAAVSNKLTYSVESYAAADDGTDANLTALTKTLMTYGDSVYTWAYTYLAGSDLTYIEAEDVNLLAGFDTTISSSKAVVSTVEDATASNGSYVTLGYKYIPYGNAADNSSDLTTYPAHISFDVKASTGGKYYIWALVKNTDTTVSATQLSYIDGITNLTAGAWKYHQLATQTEDTFVWKQIAICQWTEGGTYTVRLRARQQQVAIDRFMVTSSSVAPHNHVYSNDWSGDDTYHWHACTVDGCTVVADKAEHNFGTTGVCECGKVGFYAVGSTPAYIEAESVKLFTEKDSTYGNLVPTKLYDDGKAVYMGGMNTSVIGGTVADYPAHISFDVKVSTGGTYYIWAKVKKESATPSVLTLIEGDKDNSAQTWKYAQWGETTEYKWVKIATCNWTDVNEVYSVNLRARQQHSIIDQFVVTTSSSAPHDHVYSNDWSGDDTYHWHACTVDGCTVVADKTEHNFGTTGVCECGKVGFYAVGSTPAYIEAESVKLFTEKDSTYANFVPTKLYDDGKAVYMGGTNTAVIGGTVADYPAHISFDVKVSTGGTYYIWAKVKKESATPSVLTLIEGDKDNSAQTWKYAQWGETTQYKWVKIATCNWTDVNEVYSVNLRARQQHSIIDQFCVTSDSTWNGTT